MNILVTGANGYVGQILVNSLAQEGHSVKAVMRSNAEFKTTKYVSKKIMSNYVKHDWATLLSDVDCVVLAHGANGLTNKNSKLAQEEIETANFLAAQCQLVSRDIKIILISSSRVTNNQRANKKLPYTNLRASIEEIWRNTPTEKNEGLTILRLAQVYGDIAPNVSGGVLGNISAILKHPFPIPVSSTSVTKKVLHAKNLASAVCWSISNGRKSAGAFKVKDPGHCTTKVILSTLNSKAGNRAFLISVPAIFLKLLERISTLFLPNNSLSKFLVWSNQQKDGLDENDLAKAGWIPELTTTNGLQYSFLF